MLVSHTKEFVFTKTVKTAGTSVESFFEPWCVDNPAWAAVDARREHVSETGIVGTRSGSPLELQASVWWNHMPAVAIKALLGDDKWNRYFKFSVVRNPFDQLVSAYRFFHASRRRVQSATATLKHLMTMRARSQGDGLQSDFQNWLETVPLPLDRNKYVIADRVCLDNIIRFEALSDGVAEVCAKLAIEYDESSLGHFKRSQRPSIPLEAYYSDRSVEIVTQAYALELKEFDYSIPW